MAERPQCPTEAVTGGEGLHFLGYYDVTPWDASGRYMLALEVNFQDRPPTPEDVATIGVIDTAEGNTWRPLGETRAWNWQMGTRLQWLPSAADQLVIHNDRREGRFVAVIRDAFTGAEEEVVQRPIYALNPAGTEAVSLNFARVARTRPGYGYVGVEDPSEGELCPEDDGIWWVDLRTGESELVISLAEAAAIEHRSDMDGAEHWFNHLLWSPDGQRFIFLHRWKPPDERSWFTRLLTANPDGTEIRLLADDDLVSHFDWRDPSHILAWARVAGVGDYFFLFTDAADPCPQPVVVGRDVLTCDGHCSYSPDRRWILTDTYPDAQHERTLVLYEEASGGRLDVGRFYSPPELSGEIRCDLHPRWSRDGRKVCIDSAHEGRRQVYVVDVSEVVC